MKITILFFSTNRLEFLIPSLDTFFKYVNFGNHQIYSVLIDDYPKDRNDETFKKIKKDYKIDKLILHTKNEGYSKTWKEGWDNVPEDTDYIFHQEDDYTYHTEINITNLIKIFEKCNNELYQIVLKRQIWYEPPTSDLIYKIETGKLQTSEQKIEIDGINHYITKNKYIFNSNPCLYPYFITKVKYNDTVQEHMILEHLLKEYPNMYGCFYGKRLDNPLITHIGHFTQGKKMLPGEPGYEKFKIYDPNKKYDAKVWFKEYNKISKISNKKSTRKEYFNMIDKINDINNSNEKIKLLKKAINEYPSFLDAYYYLMIEYQNNKNYLKAYVTGISAGNKWKQYKLFRNRQQQDIYKRLFPLYLALCAYYSEFYDEAFIINKNLLEDFPNDSLILKNQNFYNQKVNQNVYKFTNKNNLLLSYFTMKPPKIMVFDDFYRHPNLVRDFALKQEFKVVGNYPGKRTISFREDYHKEMFEKLIVEKITWWPDDYNGSFQFVTENLESWIHRDKTDYSAIIFLNPNPVETTGGTVMYRHKKTKLLKCQNEEEEQELCKSSHNFEDWEPIDTIGNLYNRCVIFQGRHNHKSNKYFGSNLQNGRLFQIFFFNTENMN